MFDQRFHSDWPPIVYRCSACGEPVRQGERYLDICGMIVCEFCLDAHTYEAWPDDCDYDED